MTESAVLLALVEANLPCVQRVDVQNDLVAARREITLTCEHGSFATYITDQELRNLSAGTTVLDLEVLSAERLVLEHLRKHPPS